MNTRPINLMWFETLCPTCWHTYQWHRECRNQCKHCGADYGYLMTMSELRKKFHDLYKM